MWNCSSWTEISLTSLLCFFHALVLPVPLSGSITPQQLIWLPLLLPPSSPCLSSTHSSISHALFFWLSLHCSDYVHFWRRGFNNGRITGQIFQMLCSFWIKSCFPWKENGAKGEMRVGLNLEDLEEKYWSSFYNPNNQCFRANIIQVKIMKYECTDMRIWDNIDIRYNNIAVFTDWYLPVLFPFCEKNDHAINIPSLLQGNGPTWVVSLKTLHGHLLDDINAIGWYQFSFTYGTNKDILKTLLTLAVLMLI